MARLSGKQQNWKLSTENMGRLLLYSSYLHAILQGFFISFWKTLLKITKEDGRQEEEQVPRPQNALTKFSPYVSCTV